MNWLFKTEPDAFSIDDLANCEEQTSMWDGVRNYQARNFMRDQMCLGDKAFIYHSSCKNVGIAGIAEVVKESYPDPTQFDVQSKYYDPKATVENPRWQLVDLKFVEKFPTIIPLAAIKQHPLLSDFGLVKKGQRLSILPVTDEHWAVLMSLR